MPGNIHTKAHFIGLLLPNKRIAWGNWRIKWQNNWKEIYSESRQVDQRGESAAHAVSDQV